MIFMIVMIVVLVMLARMTTVISLETTAGMASDLKVSQPPPPPPASSLISLLLPVLQGLCPRRDPVLDVISELAAKVIDG